MCSRRHALAALALVMCLLITASGGLLWGQSASSALNGSVKDATGAMVPNVNLTLTNVATGVAQQSKTNSTGLYRFLDIPPGHYKLEVTHEGFASEMEPEFVLTVNQTATLNFTLKVGSTVTEAVVSSSTLQLETSTAELGTVVSTKEILSLPLNGRNFTELLLLTPGASPVNPLQNSGGASGSIGSFVLPAINGQSNRSNMFLLDGINNYAGGGDTYAVQPTIDDILEFKAQSHNDEAEFGQVLGGIVNLVTKSGTDQFHGSGWEFFRNDSLDATPYFSTTKTPFHQNQFGGSVGGPVLLPHYNGRNKTFFYGSYEGFRQTLASTQFYIVPTTAELTGNFSDQSAQIYNPYSAHPDPANPGQFVNDPFMCTAAGAALPADANGIQPAGTPCNVLPSSLINQTMLSYAKALFPAAKTVSSPGFNGQDNTPNTISSNQMSARIDEQLRERDRIFFRYTANWQTRVSSGGVTGDRADGNINSYNLAADYTHTFNSGLVHVTFGRVYGNDVSNPELNAPSDFLSNTDFAPNFYNHQFGSTTQALIPTVQVTDANLLTNNFITGGTYADTYEYRGDGVKILGRHQFKVGGSVATDNTVNKTIGSVDVFGPLQTSNGSAAAGGYGLASQLLGLPTYAEFDGGQSYLHGGKIFGMYAEDQWRVSDRLTLNLGVRYDITDWPQSGTPADHSNITGDIDLNTGNYILQKNAPACSSTQSAPCIPGGALPAHVVISPNGRIIQNTYDNVQPRVGFAYRAGRSTVVRGSYGRFYDNWAGVIGFGANFGDSWPNVVFFSGSNLNSPTVNATATDPLNLGSGAIAPPPNPFGLNDGFLDPRLRNPYADQYNFGIQQQMGAENLLTINYVGSSNHHEDLQITGNAAPTPGPGDPQARAPYTYILPQQGYVQSIGRSNYNALQVSAEGRSQVGLTYKLVYTWSKSLNFGCDTYSNICDNQNPYNINGDKGPAGWDLRNIFAGSVIYELPFGRGKTFATQNSVVNYLIGGWQINSLVSLHSGSPYDVQGPYQIANTNNISGVVRANISGSPYAGGTKINPLNLNAFSLPAPFTFGDMSRNSLVSDWYRNADVSLFRSFPVKESMRFEFRFEVFNLTNTPVFAAPDNQLTDSTFGTVSSVANTQREVQIAGKFYF
jgi:Carboxypeptidase regulatory-like domain/TonB dependent receptor